MSSSDNQKPAQKFFTPLERAVHEDESRIYGRAQRIDREQYDPNNNPGKDKDLGAGRSHDYDPAASDKKNFDQKIYLFPDSYNALRKELYTNYPILFQTVNPETGVSLAYCMVYDAPQFIAVLNGALDMVIQVDTDNVDYICKKFLNALRVKRGVKPFSEE